MKATERLFHDPSADKEWNESYYFVFFDKNNRLGGMTRLGFKPNKNEGATFFILFLPNGSAALYQSAEEISDAKRKNMKVGAVAHHAMLGGKWNYRFEGRMVVAKNPEDLPLTKQQPELIEKISNVKMDFTFVPINEVYE